MSEFDELQATIRQFAKERQAEQEVCESFLAALYQALRKASGPGLPLNNVRLDVAQAPENWIRPVPKGSVHCAWLRLGLCEMFVRVRLLPTGIQGEYGQGGTFHIADVSEDALLILARQMLRHVISIYDNKAKILTSSRFN